MIELERTFLAKHLPVGLEKCKYTEMIDIYIPKEHEHPTLRIRKNGEKCEITKKEPIADDASEQNEHTIPLREDEFNSLSQIDGKKVHKFRYIYPYKGRTAEIDVFQGALKGLVVVDFEFETREDKAQFQMPDFCLVDVTKEKFIAGGMVCGKSYQDIEKDLDKFKYAKIH
ncbi:MAG: hypothetical protein KKG59_05970 [Nanoarchaeota archaeon]|nr:hypothetical protein [Nanoarchaeota archaeon]